MDLGPGSVWVDLEPGPTGANQGPQDRPSVSVAGGQTSTEGAWILVSWEPS